MPDVFLKADRDVPETLEPHLDTLPKLFLQAVERFGRQNVAMRKKRYGIWRDYTWEDSYRHVRDFTLGLLALGLKRGDKVCVIGENDPEYYWAEYAIQAAGGVMVGIFTDSRAQELQYVLTNSDSVLIVAHDQEQVDKALEIRPTVSAVMKVIYWDQRGLWGYDDPWLMSFDQCEALGREYDKQHPKAFEDSVKVGTASDAAIFSYTSGTTGLPKAAMITHANLIYGNMQATMVQPIAEGDDYVSFSPMAWIAEQGFGVTTHVRQGSVINFPEKAETVLTDIREVAPVALLFPSRNWEALVRQVQARMVDATWLNRWFYGYFLPLGYKIADMADEGKQPSGWQKFLYALGNLAIYGPLRDKLGLPNIKYAYTGGAALSPDVLRFFRALSVELLQVYGSTECQTHTVHHIGDVQLGTVGQPPPGVQIRITEEGEVAVKSRSVFAGYYKAEEKTKEVIRDGWFYTGDAGYVAENGHLVYLDRMSDMIELASGEKFSPQYIEGRVKFNPYVQDVMAVGGFDMPYVTALITLNFDNAARWAEKRALSFTTMNDLSQRTEIYDLLEQEIARVNQLLPPKSRVRRFVILNKSFDADEAELTRTRKLRRRYLEQRHSDILSAMYGGQNNVIITSETTYQDGRKASSSVEINIRTVGDGSDLPIVEGLAEKVKA
jgi:long-chain acyl-CoA synthetase